MQPGSTQVCLTLAAGAKEREAAVCRFWPHRRPSLNERHSCLSDCLSVFGSRKAADTVPHCSRGAPGAALLVFFTLLAFILHTHTCTHTHWKNAWLCIHVKAIDFLPLHWSPDQYLSGTMHVNTQLKIRGTSPLMSFCFRGLSPGKKRTVIGVSLKEKRQNLPD